MRVLIVSEDPEVQYLTRLALRLSWITLCAREATEAFARAIEIARGKP